MTDLPSSEFTVMVVEDHPDQRDLLQTILQKEGYRVITAENGLDAWEKLKKLQCARDAVGYPPA